MRWHGGWYGQWHRDWFGIIPDGTVFPGSGDSGVATIALELEAGYKVRHSWTTNIIAFRGGSEQRRSRNSIDRESFDGEALLLNTRARAVRAQMARFAAAGSVFLLGLPHEALALRADASGTSVPVAADELALTDWTKTGQRVVVCHPDEDDNVIAVDAVVQDKTADAIVLDVSPGTPYGGWIMPVRHVYLEPEQNFPRYEADIEAWELRARSAVPMTFVGDRAQLALGPITSSPAFDSVIIKARQVGVVQYTFAMFASGGAPLTGLLTEAAGAVTFFYRPDVTMLGDLATALQGSVFQMLTGTYNPADTIAGADQIIVPTSLTGGSDEGDVGTGATLVEYADRPVWHREIALGTSISDGLHAMTRIIDHGGRPYSMRMADQAHWYRSVAIDSGDRATWQWFKLFMSTVRGRQRKFWLPTWREDLTYVAHLDDQLVISADDDVRAWWPAQRQHIQLYDGGSVEYREIIGIQNGIDDTLVLTLDDTIGLTTIERISWLELCRFENADSYETTHDNTGFDVSLLARVVP